MKISANELRLCNYVNDNWQPSNEPLQLNEMEFKVRVLELNCKDLSPIPLTEQWLKDFGFRKDKDGYFYKMAWSPGHPSARFDIEWKPELGLLLKSRYQEQSDQLTMIHIKHIHQLQNLYYCLCEKELTK